MESPLHWLHILKPWLLTLALPPAPMLVLMLISAYLLRRSPRLAWGLTLAAAASLWLACTEAGADLAHAALLGRSTVLAPSQLEGLKGGPPTAILVLGGGAYQDVPEYGGASLKPISLERLRYGAWLSRQTGLPLAYTGGVGWGGEDGDLAEGPLARSTIEQEYGLRLLFAESRSRDTRENASLSLPLLRQLGIERIILVTHVQHMPRAHRAFSRAADGELSIITAPVGSRPANAPFIAGDWLPSSVGFSRTRYVIYEWLGLRMGH